LTQRPRPVVTFLGCGGIATTVDIARDAVMGRRALDQIESLGMVQSSQWDGCPVDAVAFDSGRGVVFLVLPDRAREEPDVPRHYRITAASFPGFARIASVDLPITAERHVMIFDPVHDRLLIQFSNADSSPSDPPTGWPMTLLSLASPSLRELGRGNQRILNVTDGSYVFPLLQDRQSSSGTAHFTRDGTRIVDRDRILEFSADTLVGRRHERRLTPAQQARAAAYFGADSARPLIRVAAASPARVLVRLGTWEDDRPTGLAFLRDLDGSAEHPVLEIPRGRLTLLDDGRHLLLQEFDGSGRRSTAEITMTGRARIYDGETGREVASVSDPRLTGPFDIVRPVCSTPDASRIYMRTAKAELAVLRVGRRDLLVLPGAMVHPTDHCIFTTR
jgi:hypothetical protein